MKKIISLILAVIMTAFGLSITAGAETQELVFPMTTTTGTVIFKGVAGFNCNIEPDVTDADYIILKETGEMPKLTNVKLVVTGDRGRAYAENVEYLFINYYDSLCTERAKENEGNYWKLNISKGVAYLGDFLADSYSRLYSISIEVEGKLTVTKEEDYTKWYNKSTIEGWTFDIVRGFTQESYIIDTIETIATSINTFDYVTRTVKYDYPILYNTDDNGDGNITRNEVYCLSRSAYGGGEGVYGFEGLASQVGQFFNKKDSGTITFHITTAPASYSQIWSNGGVASTQTGLLNDFRRDSVLIGLFFNYDKTGSLVSTSTIDENGNIVFNIDDILNDVGGNSLATINSIYYGMVGGLTYTNEPFKGIKVDKVTLSYEEEEEEIVVEPVCVDEVEEEEVVEDIEEVEQEEIEEPVELDEEEIEIEIEPEEVSEEPEIEIVTDANSVTVADEDTNPGTGVALAVVPAIVAAAVIVVSKKRK